MGGQVGHPGTVLEFPINNGPRDTQTQGFYGASRTIQGQSWSVQVTMVHRIHRHTVCGWQVGHPGIVLESPSNYSTWDIQAHGLCGASPTSRDSPGVSE